MKDKKILIVEDERLIAMVLEMRMKKLGFQFITMVFNGEDAVKRAFEIIPDLIIMDICLGGSKIDGIDAARLIKEKIDIPIIFSSALYDQETLSKVKPLNPAAFIQKPIDDRKLILAVEDVFKN